MVDLKIEHRSENSKKRVRDEVDDTEANSPDSKLARVDPIILYGNSRDSGVSSPEAKRIHDDLFNFLDDAEPDPAIQDLDSVIKSFEEEILVLEHATSVMTEDSVESRPELGFLLEASDCELGLPPSFSAEEEQKFRAAVDLKTSESEAVDLDDMALGFVNELPSCEAYNFRIGGDSDGNANGNGIINVMNDFITLADGLFEGYEPGDISEFALRPDSLSAS